MQCNPATLCGSLLQHLADTRQDFSFLLLMKLLWTAGSNGCKEIALPSSVKSDVLNSLVTEDRNCNNGYFLGYKDVLYVLKIS